MSMQNIQHHTSNRLPRSTITVFPVIKDLRPPPHHIVCSATSSDCPMYRICDRCDHGHLVEGGLIERDCGSEGDRGCGVIDEDVDKRELRECRFDQWTKLLGAAHVAFFFSSRRRHTRFDCDWSSDVCSSDLTGTQWKPLSAAPEPLRRKASRREGTLEGQLTVF